MVSYAPVPAPFIRFAGEWVDEALGFAVSWSFLFNQLFLIPFEMTAFQRLIGFWTDKLPVEATTFILIFLYALLNGISVKWFGRAEYEYLQSLSKLCADLCCRFCLALLKVFLIFLTFAFTFVTMVGGNPQHDAYGFRYWNNPGAFAEYLVSGRGGQALGFLNCMTYATFTICGPEYIAMVAAETKAPRRILPIAYRYESYMLLLRATLIVVAPSNSGCFSSSAAQLWPWGS